MEEIGPEGIKRQRLDSAGNSSVPRMHPHHQHYSIPRTSAPSPQLHSNPAYGSVPLTAPHYANPPPSAPYTTPDSRHLADQQQQQQQPPPPPPPAPHQHQQQQQQHQHQQHHHHPHPQPPQPPQQYGHPSSGYSTPSRQTFPEGVPPPPLSRRESVAVSAPGRSPPDTMQQQPQPPRPATHHAQLQQQQHPPPPGPGIRPINTEFGGQEYGQPYTSGPSPHPGEIANVDPGVGGPYANRDQQQQHQPNGTYSQAPMNHQQQQQQQQSQHQHQHQPHPPPTPTSGPPHPHLISALPPAPAHPSAPSTPGPGQPPPHAEYPDHMAMSGMPYQRPYAQPYPGMPQPPSGQQLQQHQQQGPPLTPGQSGPSGQQFKRNARAQQACENCRARKAKCDEGKPQCGHCKEVNAECKYKDLPPAKHERAQKELMDKYDSIKSDQAELNNRFESMQETQESMQETQKQMMDILKHLYGQQGSASPLANPQRPVPGSLEPSVLVDAPPTSFAKVNGTHERQFKPSGVVQVAEAQPDTAGGPILVYHKTGAHRLLRWPSIKNLLNSGPVPVVVDENYVMKLEEQRGVLHYYGKGQSQDRFDGSSSDGPSSPASAASDSIVNAAETWGTDLGRPFLSDGNFYPEGNKEEHLGGMYTDGTLNLQGHVMFRLMNSYISNMHIMHPFLHRAQLRRMFDRVWQQANPGISPSNSPFADSALPGNRPQKRKFSADLHMEPGTPGPTSASRGSAGVRGQDQMLERRISTAIVLLVMAMGKICEHNDPLPGPVPDGSKSTPLQAKIMPVHTSAMMSVKSESPASSGSPHRDAVSGVPSPASMTAGILDRGPSSSSTSVTAGMNSYDGYGTKPIRSGDKNVDVIPGLAYYIRAAEILGLLHGGNELPHAQAFILASLYTSQIACVLESWTWLQDACRVARFLVREDYLRQETLQNPDRANIIKFVFFTALQLESDITAELDVQSSGIHQLHKDRVSANKEIGYPAMIADKPAQIAMTFNMSSENGGFEAPKPSSTSSETINMFYSYQLSMRTMLNDIQEHLYPINGGPMRKDHQDGFDMQLSGWRNVLLANLRWNDMDDPSTDMNEARLRAKYYGARYIVHRPSLEHALHNMTESDWPRGFWGDDVKSDKDVGMNDDFDSNSVDNRYPTQLTEMQDWVLRSCKTCINSAIQSTIAFDGLLKEARGPRKWKGRFVRRLKVTNIFGTAHAQFGNMLVLAATYKSYLSSLIDKGELEGLLKRTIKFLRTSTAISPTLHMDAIILEHVYNNIRNEDGPKALANHASAPLPGSEKSTPVQQHHHPTPIATINGSFSSV